MIRQMEVSRMNKKSICKWESTCDDDCRRPYGNCPENCQNYKPYVSIEQLEKENAELKKETKRLSAVDETNELLLKHQNSLKKEVHDLRKENAELKAQIEQLSNDNHVLKTSFITQQKQIEKMKCCGNCKFRQKDTLNKRCFECKDVKDGVIRLFHWGLAK